MLLDSVSFGLLRCLPLAHIFFFSTADLVSEVRMFIGDLDLLLETLIVDSEFADTVFKNELLDHSLFELQLFLKFARGVHVSDELLIAWAQRFWTQRAETH